ncbi:MAG: hypothetical protein IKQ16_02830 [Lentisphaeria bacterium]|nr:hypothetical protein [Lentisphaeria bacterium]
MKKILLTILGLMTLTAVHAQQTVVIERPGIFTDLASAATALVTLPVAVTAGIVEGTVEAFRDAVTGSTTVIRTPAPVVVQPRVVAPAPVVVAPPVVAPAPVIVAPPVVSPECCRIPHVSTTTITTQTVSPSGSVTVQSYTRPISAYEIGVPIAPVPVEHRVGTSPCVNPYVFRYR